MRRMILKTLLALVVIFVVAAGAALFLVHNESFLKSQVHAVVLKQTGRELNIDGPLQVEIGRETRVIAEGIRFQNAAWAESPDMVEIGRLEVGLVIPSLWGDTVIVPAVALEDCRVSLRKNATGEANWNVLPAAEEPVEPGPPSTELPVLLQDLLIRNCQLDVVGLDRGQALAIEIDEAGLQMDEASRAQGKGAGRLNGEGFSFNGWISPLKAFLAGGKLEHELRLDYGDVSLRSEGTLEDAAALKGADIEARLLGPDIGRVLSEFSLPPLSEGPFDFQVRLDSQGQMTKLDVIGDLGSLEIRATGEIDRLAQPQFGQVDLAVNGPNLEAVGAVLGGIGLVPEPFSIQGKLIFDEGIIKAQPLVAETQEDRLEASGILGPAPAFANSDIAVQLVSNELGRWRGRLGLPQTLTGPVAVTGRLFSDAAGQFSVDAQVRRLGGASIDISGSIGDMQGVLEPDLQIDAHSPDLQPLGQILGVENLPAAPASARGGVRLVDQTLHLNAVDIDLSGHHAVVNGAINLADNFTGSRLELELDSPNVAELGQLFGETGLPAQPLSLKLAVEPKDKGLAFQVQDGNMGDIQIDIEGTLADMERPQDVTARFDVYLPSLSMLDFLAPDRDLPDLPFTVKGNLVNDERATQLEKILVTAGPHRASVDGYLKHTENRAGSRLKVDLDIADLAELGNLLGHDGLPSEPLRLDIVLQPQEKGLVFQVKDGNQGAVQLEIEGRIVDMEEPLIMDARFDIRLPKLSNLSFLAPGKELPDAPFTANGNLRNLESKTSLEQVRLTLGKINATIEGDLLTDRRFNLRIRATGPDASVLGEVTGQSLPEDPFSISASLAGSSDEVTFSDLDVALGESRVNGHITLGLGERTRISGEVESPFLDLRHWTGTKEPKELPPQKTPPPEWRFDETPIMQWAPQGLDMQTKIQISELLMFNTSLTEIELGISLDDEIVEITPFRFKGVRGGRTQVDLRLDATGSEPEMLFKVRGDDIRLGLASAPGQDPATVPPLELDILLNGEGNTRRDMASSLNGKIRIYQGSGNVAKAGLDLIFSDFLTQLFTQLNPFAKTSEYTQLDCSVFAADASNGKIKVYPVILHTEQLTILSEGTVDLHTENIDLSFNTKPRKGLGLSAGALINPMIKVGGRLTSPAVELDPEGTVTSTGLAVATVGISLLAKSMSDRFLSSKDPCGDARKEIDKRDRDGG